MTRVTPALIALSLLLCGCSSNRPTEQPVVNRSVVELSCQLPDPPLDQTLAALVRALVASYKSLGECRAAALAGK